MKNNLIKLTLAALTTLGLVSLTATAPVSAATDICSMPGISDEIKAANGCVSDTGDTFSATIQNILTAIIGISGLVAVVFIIVGGVTYMTSAGDAGKTLKAKNTILYACIGLVVCALAFVIVNWAISVINTSDSTPASGSDSSEVVDSSSEES